MATGESGFGREKARPDWFHPVNGGGPSVSRDCSNGEEDPGKSECVNGVCPVPWTKPEKISKSQIAIATICDDIKNLLLEKNKKYGDSALNPVRIFSQASPKEQILVRIDDKLSRIQKGAGLIGEDEDVIQDLIGYLILLKVVLNN